ncbi:MAG: hypothetical protein LUQ66_03260 [Methanoregula sp.]|nr:hypothetical protein [Methanoregula sp.]
MDNRRRVTEEDLLITEALIAKSYGRLKQSVVQAPSRAFRSLGQTAREHPYATAGTAVVAGVVLYGIIKKMTSPSPAPEARERSRAPLQKEKGGPDLLHELLPLIIPLAAPYIIEYIQKYLGTIHSEKRY